MTSHEFSAPLPRCYLPTTQQLLPKSFEWGSEYWKQSRIHPKSQKVLTVLPSVAFPQSSFSSCHLGCGLQSQTSHWFASISGTQCIYICFLSTCSGLQKNHGHFMLFLQCAFLFWFVCKSAVFISCLILLISDNVKCKSITKSPLTTLHSCRWCQLSHSLCYSTKW